MIVQSRLNIEIRHFNIELGDYSIAPSGAQTRRAQFKLAFEDSLIAQSRCNIEMHHFNIAAGQSCIAFVEFKIA